MSEADEYGPGGDRESGPQSEDAIRSDSAACPYCGSVACGCTAPARLVEAEAALRAAREDCHPSAELYFKRFPEADT